MLPRDMVESAARGPQPNTAPEPPPAPPADPYGAQTFDQGQWDAVWGGTTALDDAGSANQRAWEYARSSQSYDAVRFQHTPGEGTDELRDIMRRLESAPPIDEVRGDLLNLALITGDDPDGMEAQYERFLQQRAGDIARGSYVPLDESMHPEFMGSPDQLAYGRIVGDVSGLNPGLASLLNPTGGMPGAGNEAYDDFGRNSSLGMWGTQHDAMGYLRHNMGIGPGYRVLDDPSPGDGPEGPMSGQWTGAKFWSNADGEGLGSGSFSEFGKRFILDGGHPDQREWTPDAPSPSPSPRPNGAPTSVPARTFDLTPKLTAIQDAIARVRANLGA
jgi:hypothetical protein